MPEARSSWFKTLSTDANAVRATTGEAEGTVRWDILDGPAVVDPTTPLVFHGVPQIRPRPEFAVFECMPVLIANDKPAGFVYWG
jgi:hypothetical protein